MENPPKITRFLNTLYQLLSKQSSHCYQLTSIDVFIILAYAFLSSLVNTSLTLSLTRLSISFSVPSIIL